MQPEELEDFVKFQLADAGAAWQEVQNPGFATAYPAARLSLAEKALVYYYTHEGYRSLNAELHASAGRNQSVLGQELVQALRKLPAYVAGRVFSGVHLGAGQLADYQVGHKFCWPAFLSTSTVYDTAREFLKYGSPGYEKNSLFLITPATGRLIDELSCYGPHGRGRPLESEVLFGPNREFVVDKRRETGTRSGVIELTLLEVTSVL